ncbi:MAG: cyclic nucleotide-binding domain-containing protein [Betaproteobacteria bacterium]|nr:cyclic nucleotide-binding domain-containing protein [Betaproteobacteria bacterium]
MSEAPGVERVGKYPVVRKLGEGATAEVFLCRDPFNDRDVAVKRIHPDTLREPETGKLYRKLFFTEASLAGRISHPHVVQIYDAVVDDDTGYIVMEYVPGGTLERYAVLENLLPIAKVVEIAFKCTRALAYAHAAGVTHRDIKPGNILFGSGPTDIKISDFGLALQSSVETTQISGIGSPAYMSPEQIRDEEVDHRTDIYSLGVVMYQLLTGVLPYQATNNFSIIYQITNYDPPLPSTHRKEIPLAVDKIVRRAMQKDAARRFQTWEDFSRELTEAFRADRVTRKAGEEFGDTDKFNALRGMPFFKRFSDAELWEVVGISHWDPVQAGTVLMREDEPGEFFCLVASGEMKVTKHRKLLSLLGPGECFGEMAGLSEAGNIRGTTVAASADSRVVRIRNSDLEDASDGLRRRFDRAFIGILVDRLNAANSRLATAG